MANRSKLIPEIKDGSVHTCRVDFRDFLCHFVLKTGFVDDLPSIFKYVL